MLNMVVVIGKVAKRPQVRALPNGMAIASFDLQVPRPGQPADVVPVALFDDAESAGCWDEGHDLLALGRVRRRFFRMGGATQSRTEVVADSVLSLDQRSDCRGALVSATEMLANLTEELG